MTTYEQIDRMIKDEMVKAVEAAGPAGLTQDQMHEVEFEAMEEALRLVCGWRDEVIAILKAGPKR